MTAPLPPAGATEGLDDLLARLRPAQHRLDDAVRRAGRLEDALRWEAPSAAAYRVQADELRRLLVTADASLEEAAAALRAARARMLAAGVSWAG
jgi:hypothetical protein